MGQDEPSTCTDRCRSTQHGDIITAAISRRSVSDFDLCSYLSYICTCCESVKDSIGRTALHVAASCGRIDLVRWLVQNRHANINAKDDESGFTALHRSIFYGKINVAVELIKLGANTTLLDANSLSMLDHAMMDGFKPESKSSGEIYAWGSNSNNSLGPQQSREIPELLDVFHKKYPDELVCKVVVEKFHSVIVTASGKVYSCGHGQGGRLGLGTQNAVVEPELVNFPHNNHGEVVTCLDAAISRDHSLFLCSDGNLYSCGLNTHRVLGLKSTPQQLLVPTQLSHLPEEVNHVCASQYHSVAWGPNGLYTWGLNAGQIGHKRRTDGNNYIIKPKAVSYFSETKIVAVDSSDGAVSVYTQDGTIYVLHEYKCRRIASRQLNVIQLSIFGGKLDSSLSKELLTDTNRELKVVALTNTGNLMLWQESDSQLCRCIYSLNRPIIVTQVCLNNNGLLFVTKDGEAFQGFIKPRKKKTVTISIEKSAFHKFLEREDCVSVKLSKFPRIHRAVMITSDAKGHDYCVIQVPPYKRFEAPHIIESEMKENLHRLLQECHENDDLHDVVLQVKQRYFPAHRYILASKSSYFEKLLIDGDKLVVLEGHDPLIFEQFILYLYVGDCDLLKCGECDEKFKELCEKRKNNEENAAVTDQIDGKLSAYEVYNNKLKNQKKEVKQISKSENPVRMLHEMAKKFGCAELCTILSNYDMQKFIIKKKTPKEVILKPIQFKRTILNEFCDVTIKCADGNTLKAHKCILASQSDYFNNLFSSRWRGTETSTITLPCSRSIAEALLEYLYTETLSHLTNKEHDHLFKLIILADHLFITRLKEQCECLLFRCLTLKNCVQILTFANIYNALKLKYCCLKFIVSNMAPLLELRLFDDLDDQLLKELTDFYFEDKEQICCRVITPYSTAPLEEEILSVSTAYPVSLSEEVEKVVQKSSQKRRSRPHKSSLDSSQKFKENIDDDNILQFPVSPPDVTCDIEHVVPSRLKAIKLAEEKIEQDDYSPEFTKLVSKNSLDGDVLGTSFEEFPLLNSPPTSIYHSKSPHKFETKHKIVKMSQKQRKRLSSESNSELPPESPKNPWKIVSDVVSPPSFETSISEIISSEKKQKENLVKIKSKQLFYTQIEDKAIEDLCKFYNGDTVSDEFITVERVNMGAVAAPVWVPGVKKLE